MIVRLIAPEWVDKSLTKVIEGDLTDDQLKEYNSLGYNVYFFPNYPSIYDKSNTINGFHIDKFEAVFIDMDLKDGKYTDKDQFLQILFDFSLIPTRVVDSGHGVHAYWHTSDLDVMNYLRLQRRLARHFNTDPNVSKICQLMRLPGYVNTKYQDSFTLCEELYSCSTTYSCEALDKALPIITNEDAEYCQRHFDTMHGINRDAIISDKIPPKFNQLVNNNAEVARIWVGGLDDRSGGDYRLGHIMFATNFTKEEALSVLVNSAKALQRAPVHRVSYASNIIDKIWTYEEKPEEFELLSESVEDILSKDVNVLQGTRLASHRYLDNTDHGFRLGHVIGFAAGTGVGKTTISLNAFLGFVTNNPDYIHFFVSLEQPKEEIAARWKLMCGDNDRNQGKVQILGNRNKDGSYRSFTLATIKEYIKKYEKFSGKKVGCVCLDHVGKLETKHKTDFDSLKEVFKELKAFALETNTIFFVLSQVDRSKSGIGDIELDKDAAYGSTKFEQEVDYLITMWQPLKRVYYEGAPTITSYKFCKIRHKNVKKDFIKEDTRYNLYFDPDTYLLKELTQDQETQFNFYNNQAVNLRKQDKKTSVVTYVSMRTGEGIK